MIGIIKSYAKVNLGLEVVRKTKNNYHKLKMIMTQIELYDELYFEDSNDVIVETDNNVCKMEDNLCYKIIIYIKKRFRISKGIKLKIKKNIPDGGGLGGGSSNAAAVLMYLNKKWDLSLSIKQMKKIGFMFGCDIPFFITGNISFVSGYGEKVKELKVKEKNDDIILFIPNFKNNTGEVFKNFQNNKKERSLIFKLKRELKKGNYKEYLFNDLECAANKVSNDKIYNIIEKVKSKGLNYTIMTGSGSTIVSYIPENNDVDAVVEMLKEEFGNCKIIKTKLKMYSY